MSDFQSGKLVVQKYHDALALSEKSDPDRVRKACSDFLSEDCTWWGVEPFGVKLGPSDIASDFWIPLLDSFGRLQRRDDIMLCGRNEVDAAEGSDAVAADDGHSVWVCCMGHLVGLFDQPWLSIPPTGRLCFIKCCEFC